MAAPYDTVGLSAFTLMRRRERRSMASTPDTLVNIRGMIGTRFASTFVGGGFVFARREPPSGFGMGCSACDLRVETQRSQHETIAARHREAR